MNIREQKAHDFATRWQGRGDEKQETQKFWLDLLQNVLDRSNALEETEFEHPTALGGYIDVLSPDARFLVEQKSINIDLDKSEIRQGTSVTPVEQALRYANYLPADEKPRIICTCNFHEFRFYDLNADPAAKSPIATFTLEQLPDHMSIFDQIYSPQYSRIIVQQKLSEQAGILVANIHNALAKEYQNPNDEKLHHALATLTVRIVFCLYAEDSGLFRPTGSFSSYVRGFEAHRLHNAMRDLFEVLDTPYARRDPYLDEDLKHFPYVNGGLFAESIKIPQFTDDIRNSILDAGDSFNWKDISPVIFGSLMEETLSHDQRRAGGMHYTTVENIHRVIDPLFLNDLKDQLADIENTPMGDRARENRLREFQTKIAGLQFLDPACGSGNFLTETFLELRKLENRVLEHLLHHQGVIEFGADTDAGSLVKVSISQMHGIEINDFAVSVAKTALWIAQQQALDATESIAGKTLEHLPLHDSGNIIQANALQYDWNQVLQGSHCDYVMGNPPFVGRKYRTRQNMADMKSVWGNAYNVNLDYSTCWHKRTAEYLQCNKNSAFALVSTNSVCQGEPVPILFKPLKEAGWRIAFAHRTFAWNAQSTDTAHVHVIIVGMDQSSDIKNKPSLYTYKSINSKPQCHIEKHINAYLVGATDIFVDKRNTPLSQELQPASFGAMANDGGNLIIKSQEDYDQCLQDPIAARYVRPYLGSEEVLHGRSRWCLWLRDASGEEIKKSPFLQKRVKACREWRSEQKPSGQAYKKRTTPQLFGQMGAMPQGPYLCVPRVVSADRQYFTVKRFLPETLVSDACFTIDDPDGLSFAILSSSMFLVWQDCIGGRLKSDYRFSRNIVWNNLPLPKIPPQLRESVIEAGKNIEQVRERYPDESLASLYSALSMRQDLKTAHDRLDHLVDKAFGARKPCHTDKERLTILFTDYEKLTTGKK